MKKKIINCLVLAETTFAITNIIVAVTGHLLLSMIFCAIAVILAGTVELIKHNYIARLTARLKSR